MHLFSSSYHKDDIERELASTCLVPEFTLTLPGSDQNERSMAQ